MRPGMAGGLPALMLLACAAQAQLVGKVAPELRVTEARGAEPTVKLADYRGKWVAIEFWGYW